MRVVRRRPAAVLAATVLALSACGGGGEGGSSSSSSTASPQPVEPSSSSSSSASSSSSSSSSGGSEASDLPEAATKHTQEGAVAFAKYYWNESSRAAHEGSTSTLERLYEPECAPCQEYVDMINEQLDKGYRANIVATRIKETTVTDETNGLSDQAVRLVATDAEHTFVDESGESVGRVEELDYRIIIYVDWSGGEWSVVDSYMIT